MENTLAELNNPLRMNRDARASSAGLSGNDKPFSVETIKERYWKREYNTRRRRRRRRAWLEGEKQLLGTMEMILTRPPLWRSLLPPLFSWLNVILWIAFENKKIRERERESGRHQAMRTFRNSDEIFQTAAFKFENHIVYVFMKKKMGYYKNTKTNPCAFLSRPV